jgi:hypothetical protein
MKSEEVTCQRLLNQHITGTAFTKPAEMVQWLGAVQSQDYPAAKWALGLRLPGISDADIDQAIADGSILRTHVMRPTWHFVAPADIRWMLELTAPRVKAAMSHQNIRLGLDDDVFAHSNAAIAAALQGGKQLTRAEVVEALKQSSNTIKNLVSAWKPGGTVIENLGFVHLLMHAELDAVMCSGAQRGKQATYALLAERAPQAKTLPRDEALAELARRYFTSHGPATARDFAWWSGLAAADARAGLEMVKSALAHEGTGNQQVWFAEPPLPTRAPAPTAHLLPNYDEYIVGYTERSAIFDPAHTPHLDSRGNPLFQHTMVLDRRIVGTWQRTLKKDAVSIATNPFTPLSEQERLAFASEAERYGQFLRLPVSLS